MAVEPTSIQTSLSLLLKAVGPAEVCSAVDKGLPYTGTNHKGGGVNPASPQSVCNLRTRKIEVTGLRHTPEPSLAFSEAF